MGTNSNVLTSNIGYVLNASSIVHKIEETKRGKEIVLHNFVIIGKLQRGSIHFEILQTILGKLHYVWKIFSFIMFRDTFLETSLWQLGLFLHPTI